jgi:AcrR family transcriptional regulator
MSDATTKEKLLNAAVDVFAAKGFQDATVAEICDQAGANVASVNYHFGSKEKLLREVIRRAFDLAESKYPFRGNLAPGAPAEDRLRAFMRAMILRCFDPGPAGCFDRIMSHEMKHESDRHNMAITECRQLHGQILDGILSEFLGTRSRPILDQARVAVIGLCFFPNVIPHTRSVLFPGKPTPAAIRRYIDRQVTFALAGLSALAKPNKQHA